MALLAPEPNGRLMHRRISIALVIIAVATTCVACSPSGPPEASLANTKSPTQLLRNESVDRLPSADVDSVKSTDESQSCDGDELVRRWVSTATITLSQAASESTDQAMTTLAASFEADGWVVSPGNERLDEEQAVLTSGTSPAEIRLISRPGADGALATIAIQAAGPCVLTDGPDSDEVTQLEGG